MLTLPQSVGGREHHATASELAGLITLRSAASRGVATPVSARADGHPLSQRGLLCWGLPSGSHGEQAGSLNSIARRAGADSHPSDRLADQRHCRPMPATRPPPSGPWPSRHRPQLLQRLADTRRTDASALHLGAAAPTAWVVRHRRRPVRRRRKMIRRWHLAHQRHHCRIRLSISPSRKPTAKPLGWMPT